MSTASASPSPTPVGSITDVDGVLVGHHQRTGRGWQTGTTTIIVPAGATPGVDVRGGGPGTRETDALAPENLVQQIHGVCLTGGSAYGLAAADGVMSWLEERGLGFPVGITDDADGGVVPVVPAAVVFDLGRGGAFSNRPDREFGWRAARQAQRRQRRWGSVGAGTGAKAGGLQGGVGTASMTVRLQAEGDAGHDVVVGALAVVNSNGSVIDPATGLPWDRRGFRLRKPATTERRALRSILDGQATPRLNTTIGVVATSARLDKAETSKLASVAHDGLARAVQPAHSMFDGDTIFGLATGEHSLSTGPTTIHGADSRHGQLNQLLEAGARVFARACVHAVLSAVKIGDLPAYSGICPSVLHNPAT